MDISLVAPNTVGCVRFQEEYLNALNTTRYFHVCNNWRIIDTYLNRDLGNQYSTTEITTKSKTFIDLAIRGYKSENNLRYDDTG